MKLDLLCLEQHTLLINSRTENAFSHFTVKVHAILARLGVLGFQFKT